LVPETFSVFIVAQVLVFVGGDIFSGSKNHPEHFQGKRFLFRFFSGAKLADLETACCFTYVKGKNHRITMLQRDPKSYFIFKILACDKRE